MQRRRHRVEESRNPKNTQESTGILRQRKNRQQEQETPTITKQLMKIEMAIKNKIDKVPVVRLNARRGTETPGARPAKRMTVNLTREQRETRL